MIFLTAEEIRQLTGYKYPARQARWLQGKGIPHWVNAAGKVIVTRAAIENKAPEFRLGKVA